MGFHLKKKQRLMFDLEGGKMKYIVTYQISICTRVVFLCYKIFMQIYYRIHVMYNYDYY